MRTTPTQDKDLITSHQSPIQWAIIEIHLIANTLQQEIRTLRALPSLITTTSSLLPLPIHTILNLTKTRLSKINTNLLNIPIVEWIIPIVEWIIRYWILRINSNTHSRLQWNNSMFNIQDKAIPWMALPTWTKALTKKGLQSLTTKRNAYSSVQLSLCCFSTFLCDFY